MDDVGLYFVVIVVCQWVVVDFECDVDGWWVDGLCGQGGFDFGCGQSVCYGGFCYVGQCYDVIGYGFVDWGLGQVVEGQYF